MYFMLVRCEKTSVPHKKVNISFINQTKMQKFYLNPVAKIALKSEKHNVSSTLMKQAGFYKNITN